MSLYVPTIQAARPFQTKRKLPHAQLSASLIVLYGASWKDAFLCVTAHKADFPAFRLPTTYRINFANASLLNVVSSLSALDLGRMAVGRKISTLRRYNRQL
jgi:hypothetical protein